MSVSKRRLEHASQEWRLLNTSEEAHAFGAAPEFMEIASRPPAAAFQFSDYATISRKKFPPSNAVIDGLQTWVGSKVNMSLLACGSSPDGTALTWVGCPQQLPLPPQNELACLWRIAHEGADSCRILRARLGFASVLAAKQGSQSKFHWHVALACAMSYFPAAFPLLPKWARRAVLPQPSSATPDTIAEYLRAFKCLVARTEEECRSEDGVRPTKADSRCWQELKKFELRELQRFKEVGARLERWDLSIKKKVSETGAQKVQLRNDQESIKREVNEVTIDTNMHFTVSQVFSFAVFLCNHNPIVRAVFAFVSPANPLRSRQHRQQQEHRERQRQRQEQKQTTKNKS